ncbi:hypothetical protein FB451DRAFT_446348, partial [Mycena latifolia]
MSSFHVRKVEPLTGIRVSETPELEKIVDILAGAFSVDEFTAIVTGRRPNSLEINPLVRPLCRSTAISGLLGGEVYVAETADEAARMVGCAVWFGPGRMLYDSEDQVQLALKPLKELFSEDLRRWWDDFIPKYENCVSSALEVNLWRLQTIAVDPEYQRQGVATLLVNTIIEKAAATNTPLCVDCSEERNVEVYQRLGFELMPKGKETLQEFREEFTGLTGDVFGIWVLSRGF